LTSIKGDKDFGPSAAIQGSMNQWQLGKQISAINQRIDNFEIVVFIIEKMTNPQSMGARGFFKRAVVLSTRFLTTAFEFVNLVMH
jgi:hypothetical protein